MRYPTGIVEPCAERCYRTLEACRGRALSTSVTAGGEQVPIYADFVFVRKGGADLTFSFLNAGEPFPADLARQLVSKVLARR